MKKIVALGLAGLLSLVTACSKNPTYPITQRTVYSDSTMFANNGEVHTLSVQDTQKSNVELSSKKPCDANYATGNTVTMTDSCSGNLEVMVKENGYDVPSNTSLIIYPGENQTDIAKFPAINSFIGANPKNISTWTPEVTANGYLFDAHCVRNDGQNIYVIIVGNNDEKNANPTVPSATVVKVNEGQDIVAALTSYFN